MCRHRLVCLHINIPQKQKGKQKKEEKFFISPLFFYNRLIMCGYSIASNSTNAPQ